MKKIFVASLFIFLLSGANFVSAQSVGDTSVVIQPSKIEVTASPDQKLARSFSIINRSNFYVNLKLVVKDYKQVSETGKLQFYDAKTEQASQWLVPQYLQIGLKPLETKDVGIVINVPKNFSGGGHYGAILFQPSGSSGNASATSNFGELVLLTVTGSNIKTSAIAKSVNFYTGAVQQGGAVDFNFKINNTGNTHFDANAKLVLKNWLGQEIGKYNIGSLTVYPKTSRLFQWRWNNTPFFGAYNAEVLMSTSNAANAKFTPVDGTWFVIFPWQLALAILLFSAAAFALIRYRKNILARFSPKVIDRKRILI